MKKLISYILIISLCLSLSGCYTKKDVETAYYNGFHAAADEYEPLIDSLEYEIADYKSDLGSSSSRSSSTTNGNIVYVTKSGDKYHRRNCSYLKSSYPMHKNEAIEKGYSRCSLCNP